MKTIVYEGISAEGNNNEQFTNCILENIDLVNNLYESNKPKNLISKLNVFSRTKTFVRFTFNDIELYATKGSTFEDIKSRYEKEKFHKYAYVYTRIEYLTNNLKEQHTNPKHYTIKHISECSLGLIMELDKHNLNVIPTELKEHLNNEITKYGLLDTLPEKQDYTQTFYYFAQKLVNYVNSNNSERHEKKNELNTAYDVLSSLSNSILYGGCSTPGSVARFKASLGGYRSPSGTFDSSRTFNNDFNL